MKHILLASILWFSALNAQEPQPGATPRESPPGLRAAEDALPCNYEVTLNFADEDGQPIEVCFVIASPQFSVALGEQNLTFSGTIAVDGSGNIVVAYLLGWQTAMNASNGNAQLVSSSSKGSVRLKPGEEVPIIRVGSRIARLSIKERTASKPK